MREIIPLKKDIVFKTLIGELSNINLDHDYKINDDTVTGTVALSGTYKMTEASVLEEDFYYTIPFSIAISKRINKDTIKIEIDDFKYNVERDTLKVNIDLELTCEELEEETEDDNYDFFEESKIDIDNTEIETEVKNIEEKEDMTNNINNITQNIINTENKYYTYKIYIVRSGDTIDSICSKYNISYDDLKEYNNLNEINVGDKIIIPSFND